MRASRVIFSNLIIFLFLTHVLYNLERIIYINEIFTILGFVCFVYWMVKEASTRSIDTTSLYVLLLISYLSILLIVSIVWLKDTSSWYLFGRTLPVFYSIFVYFLGYILFLNFENIYMRTAKYSRKLMFVSLALLGPGRLSSQTLLALFSIGRGRNFYFLLLALLVGYLALKGGSTSVVYILVAGVFCIFYRSPNKLALFFSAPVLISAFTLLIVSFYMSYSWFNEFYFDGYEVFAKDTDNNAIWRLMYNAYVLNERWAASPLFGIGFGTKLFLETDPLAWFIIKATPQTPNLPYVHGTHNSYIFILIRFGILGVFLFFMALTSCFRRAFSVWQFDETGVVEKLTVALALMFTAALFNVVLESPLYSGIFWFFLGLLSKASIHIRQRYYISAVTT